MDRSDFPLPPAAFFILFALAGGDKHGYAIMQETREISEGKFPIGPATLYTTIQRLLESRWIREAPAPAGADSRRRYYRLTRDGTAVLNLELERMESMVRKAKAMRLRSAESAS
jgi:DNA-binding PadR family transcriptional regulator